MKNGNWKKIAGIIIIFAALILTFWYGGDAPGLQGFSVNSNISAENDGNDGALLENGADIHSGKTDTGSEKSGVEDGETRTGSNSDEATSETDGNIFQKLFMQIRQTGSSKSDKKKSVQTSKKAQHNANKAAEKSDKKKKQKKSTSEGTDKDSTSKGAVSQDKQNNSENTADEAMTGNDNSSEEASSENDKAVSSQSNENESSEEEDGITCSICISCATVLVHMDSLTDATKKVIPSDGVILKDTFVKVKEDATVFDVLQKAARENKVHLEYNYTPAYKTYYIEGIGNLYEFDAGNLSGWLYSVNGTFPGVGCSSYEVNDGDVIRWVYTCDFGKDVGN